MEFQPVDINCPGCGKLAGEDCGYSIVDNLFPAYCPERLDLFQTFKEPMYKWPTD